MNLRKKITERRRTSISILSSHARTVKATQFPFYTNGQLCKIEMEMRTKIILNR